MGKDKKQTPLDKLSELEKLELESIIDRISVQNPEGESFQNWLDSLKNNLSQRQHFVAVLLDTLSRSPTETSKKVFLTLKDCVRDKELKKLVRKAGYRFEQRGLLEKEESPEKVVIFSDKLLKSIELEGAEAHVCVHPFSGRCKVTIYIPSISSEGTSLLVGCTEDEIKSTLLGKVKEYDRSLLLTVRYGSKRVYKEILDITSKLSLIAPKWVPVSLQFAATCAKDFIDLFSDHSREIPSMYLREAKDIITRILTENPGDCVIREISSISNTPVTSDEETDILSLAKSIGPFWFDYKDMEAVASSLISIVDSVLTWDAETKTYNVKRKILDFVHSIDDFYLGLYRIFLIVWAVTLARQYNKVREGLILFEISRDIEKRNISKWERFFIAHLANTFEAFSLVRQLKDKKISKPVKETAVVIAGGSEQDSSKWKLLHDFLENMEL